MKIVEKLRRLRKCKLTVSINSLRASAIYLLKNIFGENVF